MVVKGVHRLYKEFKRVFIEFKNVGLWVMLKEREVKIYVCLNKNLFKSEVVSYVELKRHC